MFSSPPMLLPFNILPSCRIGLLPSPSSVCFCRVPSERGRGIEKNAGGSSSSPPHFLHFFVPLFAIPPLPFSFSTPSFSAHPSSSSSILYTFRRPLLAVGKRDKNHNQNILLCLEGSYESAVQSPLQMLFGTIVHKKIS